MFERLENRRLWSVMNTAMGDTSFWYNGSVDADDFLLIDYSNIETSIGNPAGPPPAPVDVSGTAKNDRILISANGFGSVAISVNGKVTTQTSSTPLHILANNGDDVVWIDPALGNVVKVTIYGGAGDDTILSGDGNDRIFAGDGNDEVNGGGGNDTIYGDAGDDSVRGGGGSDNLDGGDGVDTLRGDAGNDRLVGGANPDRLRGSLGNDTLEGGGGRDLLGGEGGDDSLEGGTGQDVLDGGVGADAVFGGPDHDTVVINDTENDTFDFAEASAGESIDGGVISGAGGFTKSGPGTLVLNGSGTTSGYSGSTTISSGVLAVASTAGGWQSTTKSITVKAGSTLTFSATVNMPEAHVTVEAGGVLTFGDMVASVTLKSLTVQEGGILAFNMANSAVNTIHVTQAGGLKASGAVIKINPAFSVPSMKHTLMTFTPGTGSAGFALLPVKDTRRTYTLAVDAASGVVTVDVRHV